MVIDFPSVIYTQEIPPLKISGLANNAVSVLITDGVIDAEYRLGSAREIAIDVSDIVRANSGRYVITIYEKNAFGGTLSQQTINYTIGGLRNPYTDAMRYIDFGAIASGMVIAPPSVIFQAFSAAPLIVEAYSDDAFDIYYLLEETWLPADYNRKRVTIPVGATALEIQNTDEQYTFDTINLIPLEDCKRYVTIRWESRYGVTKQMVWEMRDIRNEVTREIPIEHPLGEYDVRKNYVAGLTAHLEGLNAYDYWYYSDIVTSSKVEVDTDGSGTFRQVRVMTDEATFPNENGGKLNDLNIRINYREYVAI